MCIIVYRPYDEALTKSQIEDCMTGNKDGWGLMWAEGNTVSYQKGRDMEKFWDAYEAVQYYDVAIHFRFKTHGDIDDANAHPFKVVGIDDVGYDLYVMHNGVIPITRPDPKKSDTWTWVENVLRPKILENPGFYNTPEFWDLVQKDVSGSRLMFLAPNAPNSKHTFMYWGNWDKEGNKLFSNRFWRSGGPKRGTASAGTSGSTGYRGEYEYYGGSYNSNASTWKYGRVWDSTLRQYVDPPAKEEEEKAKEPTVESVFGPAEKVEAAPEAVAGLLAAAETAATTEEGEPVSEKVIKEIANNLLPFPPKEGASAKGESRFRGNGFRGATARRSAVVPRRTTGPATIAADQKLTVVDIAGWSWPQVLALTKQYPDKVAAILWDLMHNDSSY